jgi:PPOX class probable F420-dependent enzyme
VGAHDGDAIGLAYGCRMKGKYLSLTSFRRDGGGVSTPVWFVEENGRLFVTTDGNSYKVKRIARNPSVTIAECSASGRLRGEPVTARAEILRNGKAEHVDELMARKYRLDKILILPIYRAVQRIRGRSTTATDPVVLAITPE